MERNNIDEYIDSFPYGFRFHPTDEELILFYLKRKLLNEPLPINRFLEINIYQYHPQELTGMQNLIREDGWYFFTPRDRKYRNGSRPNRAAPDIGYWKATGKADAIKVENQVIGYKRTLDFYDGKHKNGKREKGNRTDWKMHEYRIYEQQNMAPPNNRRAGRNEDMKLDDCVLCKIYINKRLNNNDNDNTNNAEQVDPDHQDLVQDLDQEEPVDPNVVAPHEIHQWSHQNQSGAVLLSNVTSHDHIDQSVHQPPIDKSANSSYYCAMPSTSTMVPMNPQFGDPAAAYYGQSSLQDVDQALNTSYYNWEPTNNYFNNQALISTYNIHSAHMSQSSQTESFSSSSALQEYYSSTETLEAADQIPVVDSSSIQLPVHVREYERRLKKPQTDNFD